MGSADSHTRKLPLRCRALILAQQTATWGQTPTEVATACSMHTFRTELATNLHAVHMLFNSIERLPVASGAFCC